MTKTPCRASAERLELAAYVTNAAAASKSAPVFRDGRPQRIHIRCNSKAWGV